MKVPGDQETRFRMRATTATAAGGVVAAWLSSLCCLGPLLLAAIGVGAGATGFWASAIEIMKALLPYRPLFVAVAILCFSWSFYLISRRPIGICESAGVCEQPRRRRAIKRLLWTLAGLALIMITAPYWLGL
ncbi:MAG: mercuric transporter MerT family protein [Nitrospira sp.]|nr:mercuric transporter MerT family protein [Nitrospira sp.]